MTKAKNHTLYWRSNVKGLFEEIIENGGPAVRVMDKPLKITYHIMREAAQRALEIGDEKMIAIMGRLAMYDECMPEHPGFKKMNNLIKKYFNDSWPDSESG